MSRKNDEALFDELTSDVSSEAMQKTPSLSPVPRKEPGVEEREIQQMAEMVQQMGVLITKVKSLREELMQMIKDTNMEIADFSGRVRATEDSCGELSRRMGMMSSTMEHLAVSKDELQEILKKDTFSFEPNPDAIKSLLGTLGVTIKKGFDDAEKEACRCVQKTLKEGVEATLKDGENRIHEFSEEIRQMKKEAKMEGSANIPYKWIYWYLSVAMILVCWGVVGFLLWYRLKYGKDGTPFLAWATAIAIASVPVYSIIKIIHDWKEKSID